VDRCHRDIVTGLGERFPPGDGVQEVGIDEGAVHVEQHGLDLCPGHGFFRALVVRALYEYPMAPR